MEFEYQQIEDRMKTLPKEIQFALTSTDISADIKDIGDRHDLKLDQEEALYDQTAYAMMGLTPASKFVENLSKAAGIDQSLAQKIGADINAEVFSKLKGAIQSIQASEAVVDSNETSAAAISPEQAKSDISDIERAGGFSVEHGISPESIANEPANDNEDSDANHVSEKDKTDILDSIENPEPSYEQVFKKTIREDDAEDSHVDPIADLLLKQPAARPAEKTGGSAAPVHKTTEPPINLPEVASLPKQNPPAPAQQPPKPKGPDPYHEPIE